MFFAGVEGPIAAGQETVLTVTAVDGAGSQRDEGGDVVEIESVRLPPPLPGVEESKEEEVRRLWCSRCFSMCLFCFVSHDRY